MIVREPAWVTFEEVVTMNRVAIYLGHKIIGLNEEHVVKSVHDIEGALDRPRQHFNYRPIEDEVDIALYGSALCIGISQAQGFGNGNKRTAVGALERFLNLNGLHLSPMGANRLGHMVLMTAHPDHEVRWDEERFADAIQPMIAQGKAGDYGSVMDTVTRSLAGMNDRPWL